MSWNYKVPLWGDLNETLAGIVQKVNADLDGTIAKYTEIVGDLATVSIVLERIIDDLIQEGGKTEHQRDLLVSAFVDAQRDALISVGSLNWREH